MKINLSRFLEIEDAKKTKAGEELSQTLDYLASFTEIVVRGLKNNLDFVNNFNSEVKVVSLVHNVNQSILTASGKVVQGITCIRTLTKTDHLLSFGWFIDDDGSLKVNATFRNTPTSSISCTLVILYV